MSKQQIMSLTPEEREVKRTATLKAAKVVKKNIDNLIDKRTEMLLQAEEYRTGFLRGNMVINTNNDKIGLVTAIKGNITTLGVRTQKKDGQIGIPIIRMYDRDTWVLCDPQPKLEQKG